MKGSRDQDERLQLLIQENENLKDYIVITDAREVRAGLGGLRCECPERLKSPLGCSVCLIFASS